MYVRTLCCVDAGGRNGRRANGYPCPPARLLLPWNMLKNISGHRETSEAGNKCLLVVVDTARNLLLAYTLPAKKGIYCGQNVARAIVLTFGISLSIHGDPGTELTAENICRWLLKCPTATNQWSSREHKGRSKGWTGGCTRCSESGSRHGDDGGTSMYSRPCGFTARHPTRAYPNTQPRFVRSLAVTLEHNSTLFSQRLTGTSSGGGGCTATQLTSDKFLGRCEQSYGNNKRTSSGLERAATLQLYVPL